MKYIILSDDCDSLGMICRLQDEGHEVKVFIKSKESREIGKGIINSIPDYRPYLRWADCIVIDCTGFGKEADLWRKNGLIVFGGTAESDRLEEDRAYGMKIMEKYGLTVPPWTGPFQTLQQVISFVKKNPGRYVIKPNGQADRDLTFVSKDQDDLIQEVERWIKKGMKVAKGVILQEFIEGHEIAAGSTFSHSQFHYPIQINWEHKKIVAGNLGVNTGEMGTVAYYGYDSPLIDELEKLTPYLAHTGYRTDFDLNFMVTEDTAFVMEPTARLGYPAIFIQIDNQEMEVGEYLYETANGTLDDLPMKNDWVVGVVLTAPGFPFEESYKKRGFDKIIAQIEKDCEDHLYFYEISKDKEGYKTAGSSGASLVAIGEGKTLDEAQKNVYNFIKKKDFPSWLSYRIDIGDKLLKEELSWFKKMGWLGDDK